jgi:tRNA threonylcarbamoyladenosine biosynthesis protein TsaB
VFLSLDTSTLTLSLALLEKGTPPACMEHVLVGPPRKQSEMLPAVVGELLDRHRLTFPELEGIVVGLGPGSFTGLRIGLSCAKALAYAARLPLAGASSLAAASLEGPEGVTLLPIAVARAQELYVGRHRRAGHQLQTLAPEDAVTPAELAALLLEVPDGVLLGPAVGEYRAQLLGLGVPGERLLDVGAVPSAVALGALCDLPAAYDAQALFALEPHYVRGSHAERDPKFPPLPGPAPRARRKED